MDYAIFPVFPSCVSRARGFDWLLSFSVSIRCSVHKCKQFVGNAAAVIENELIAGIASIFLLFFSSMLENQTETNVYDV